MLFWYFRQALTFWLHPSHGGWRHRRPGQVVASSRSAAGLAGRPLYDSSTTVLGVSGLPPPRGGPTVNASGLAPAAHHQETARQMMQPAVLPLLQLAAKQTAFVLSLFWARQRSWS
jgi:hypothetical protein